VNVAFDLPDRRRHDDEGRREAGGQIRRQEQLGRVQPEQVDDPLPSEIPRRPGVLAPDDERPGRLPEAAADRDLDVVDGGDVAAVARALVREARDCGHAEEERRQAKDGGAKDGSRPPRDRVEPADGDDRRDHPEGQDRPVVALEVEPLRDGRRRS